jgi:hypothetical protein
VIGRFPGETSCLTLVWAVLDLYITNATNAGSVRISPTASSICAGNRAGSRKFASCHEQAGNSVSVTGASDRLLLAERCLFRHLRQCHIRSREHLDEVALPDLYRGGPELAQQRVGRLTGERAGMEALQLGTAGPE